MQDSAMPRERSPQNKCIRHNGCSEMRTGLGSGTPGIHLEPDHAGLLRVTAGTPVGFGAAKGSVLLNLACIAGI